MKIIFLSLLFLLNCTSIIVNSYIQLERFRSDLSHKEIYISPHLIHYLEGGKGSETILLLHGFGGEKEHWTRFVRTITSKYRVIALDIPGFGETGRISSESYQLGIQIKRIEEFRKELGLGKVHIIGNSMGGSLAALYSIQYPNSVLSLGLIDSAGVVCPNPSEYEKILKETGRSILVVENKNDFDRLLDFSFIKKPEIPEFVKEYFVEKSLANRERNSAILKEIRKEGPALEAKLGDVKVETFILWGREDRIIDVSCAEVFKIGIQNNQSMILNNVGHSPNLEIPNESARLYLDFLNELKNRE
jgi:pimeloyl-ACP methyl ester carboxylesterase